MNLLGIEIGGTKLQLGLGPGDGTLARLVRLPVDPSRKAEGIRAQIVEAFRSLDTEISAAGIGFGGPVDLGRGTVVKSHQIDGWYGFPIVDWVRKELGIPVVALSNDADAAALGESLFGAGRGLSPILYVNSGSGIGGGLVIDGKIYRGSGIGAIEIGHMIIHDAKETGPYPHERMTLEQIASGWAIAERGREKVCYLQEHGVMRDLFQKADPERFRSSLFHLAGGDPDRVDARMVAESARLGHSDGRTILRLAVLAMGQALAHAVTLLAPRRVILGGGVSLMGDDLWLDPIREVLSGRVFPPFRHSYDVVTADLGEDVVVHGALALARQAVDPFNNEPGNRSS